MTPDEPRPAQLERRPAHPAGALDLYSTLAMLASFTPAELERAEQRNPVFAHLLHQLWAVLGATPRRAWSFSTQTEAERLRTQVFGFRPRHG